MKGGAVNEAEELFAIHLAESGVEFSREYRFAPPRRWRIDFLITAPPIARTFGATYPATGDSSPMFLAVEVEGGGWVGGRHTTGAGFKSDLEKYQEALKRHIIVARVSPEQVKTGQAVAFVKEILQL